jgi:hypothetical protein
MKIHLFGEKSNRTPLGYSSYYRVPAANVEFTSSAEHADMLMLGFKKDLVDRSSDILATRKRNPRLKVTIVSEEPLWDSLWSGNFRDKDQVHSTEFGEIPFLYLNHINSKIFHFENIPYFLTTSDDFYPRYASLFTRNSSMSPDEILCTWEQCLIPRAYYAEKRDSPTFNKHHPELNVHALSVYRTRLADLDHAEGVLRVGQGWIVAPRRQDRPDWHLEKLAALDRQARIVSAIENTSAPNYVSEKIFDAYAVLSIPIYHAGPNHAVHRLVDSNTFLDIAGLSPEDALKKISQFKPTLEFAESYLETQIKLADLFTKPKNFVSERNRVYSSIIEEISSWA